MDYIYIKARAKINLALDVLDKRPDGYHNLKMIMQSLYLYDTVYIKKTNSNKIELKTNFYFLPTDERNLVYKAANILREKYKIKEGISIDLEKNIPVSAGLGGGSADCAATLVGIRNLFKLPLKKHELANIGKTLGADVPFCIYNGTYLAEGIGDKLTSLSPHPDVFVLLAKPNINISTPTIFKKYNLEAKAKQPDIKKMILDIKNQDVENIAKGFSNVLESVTEKKYPIIKELKSIMIKHNAMGSLMSGSGPTVFGYFRHKNDAIRAQNYIKRNYFKIKNIYVTKIFNPKI